MFWRFGGYPVKSPVDDALEKPDCTIEDLLKIDETIGELKQQNSKLLEFLREKNVLDRLLRYVVATKRPTSPNATTAEGTRRTSEGSAALEGFFGKVKSRARSKSIAKSDAEESEDEKQRLKFAYVACEILSSDVWSISEALLEHPDSLRNFWLYMKQPPPLDPIQVGYFTKVNEALLDRKTEEMLDFLKSLDNVVPDILQHVDCPAVMDLLLKLISLEKSEGGQGIVDWLQTQNLVPILLSYLSPDHCSSTQTSAGDFLKAIITISANATTQDQSVIGPNELTRQLVSEECVNTLITDMLRGGNPLTVGVGIVIEVIRKNNSDYDLETQVGPTPKTSDPIYLGTLLRQFAKHVPDFMELISNPNHTVVNSDGSKTVRKRELKAAFGGKIEPLGFDRFKTCELMAELLHCSNMALLNERGAESEVKRRDAERERLKAEGKLAPAKETTSGQDDFGTSVDSHGFHHARAPSQLGESPEEIKRLEVHNSGEEEDFEKVAVSEVEIRDDFDEKEEIGEPLERSPTVRPRDSGLRKTETVELVDDPLSPSQPQSSPMSDPFDDNQASPAAPVGTTTDEAESPTSAGLTDDVGGLALDNDTEMSTPEPSSPEPRSTQPMTPSTPESSNHQASLLTQQLNESPDPISRDITTELSPHPEDKPAPLFAGKKDASPEKSEPMQDTQTQKTSTDIEEPVGSSLGGDNESSESVLLSGQEGDSMPVYEVDVDGSPVVGDLLKIMFVEHRVVPTILDFFFRFPWNNFLHNVVYDVVQQVFNGQMDRGFNRNLAVDLFETGRITERVIEGQQASDKSQAETSMRLGYMGHLTLIAEEVVKFTERHPPELLSQIVLEKVMSRRWIDYVEHTLAETRERDNAILGGVRPDMSVGPRQAVLNAVNASQGFGNTSSSSLANAGLSGNGSVPLDSMELTNSSSASGGNYNFSGGSLLSGFTSSDEEDEEMDDGEGEKQTPTVDDSDQPFLQPTSPRLQVQPSRARRQFALRLAQRKREMEAAARAQEAEEGEEDDDPSPELESVDLLAEQWATERSAMNGRGDPERFADLFDAPDSGEDSEDERETNRRRA
ncbi:sporulation-induced protein [Coniosporium tulheliwenetii]|uniref:Sporulation-induced protein n=1 Tax=Coniosporium tulheliwenetii TaxID=3383036 RepID=A0ACC2YII6_9PEZI|nr:sporulation-induced protein [Cladosporium sp. JES 115]